jgi:Leucine-rich repeat (LRR) protein
MIKNNLKEIDVTLNTKLKTLRLDNNKITKIDLRYNIDMEFLLLANNGL